MVNFEGADPIMANASENAKINAVVLRLAEAGVRLFGMPWRVKKFHPYPPTVYFTCSNTDLVLNAAERSSSLAHYEAGATPPSIADWVREGYTTVVYVETDHPKPIRLEIMLDGERLCRASILDQSFRFMQDAMRMAKVKSARDDPVYAKIANHADWPASDFNFDDYVAEVLRIGPNTLVGVDFIARDIGKLIEALKAQKDGSWYHYADPNDPTRKEYNDPILVASLAATKGYGLREVLSDAAFEPITQPKTDAISIDPVFSRKFDPRPQLKAKALHFAISKNLCNVHLDDVGFVFRNEKGEIIVDINRARIHAVDELGLKTKIPELAGLLGPGIGRAFERALGNAFIDIETNSTTIAANPGTIFNGELGVTIGCANCSPIAIPGAVGRLVGGADPKDEKIEFFTTLSMSWRF